MLENGEKLDVVLLSQVCASAKAVAEGQFDFSTLHENVTQLERLIFSLDRDEARATPFLQALTPNLIGALNDAYLLWETGLERQFTDALLQGDTLLSDYCHYDRFGELVRRELALVSGLRLRQILVVGSGPFPISAIHMHLQTGLPVHCVARHPDAVSIARQVLEKCGLQGSVRVFPEGDAECAGSDYDLVLIEVWAKSKKGILRNLRKRRPGCPVLCRTSLGARQLAYAKTCDRDLRGFYVKAEQVAEGSQAISTWLLEAAASAAADVRLEWLNEIDSNQAMQILRLMNRTLEEETTIGFPGPLDEQTGFAVIQQLRAAVEAGSRHLLVAIIDGLIVGQLILTPNSTPNHLHMVELTRGTIDPCFRGGGLALLAFEEIARKCEELGREVICLDVRAGTMAAVWWQHFGFKPYGLLSDYSRVGEKRYQGLYLTQTNAELKERLKEIRVSAGPAFQLAKVA
jgi:GNAT superfamily N-acetyltransferase